MSDSDFEIEKEEEKEDSASEKQVSEDKRKRSKAWDYFDRINETDRIARCRICHLKLNYRSSVSNLTKHVKRKHHIFLDRVESFFTPISELDIASCKICCKHIPNNKHDFRQHLSRLHPDVKLDNKSKIIISDDGQIYEIEQSQGEGENGENNADALEMDTVYLEEYADEIKKEIQKSNVKKRKAPMSPRVFSNARNSFDTMVQMPGRSVPSTTKSQLDLFGSYLVSLLKELPDRESKRLQGEFVKLAVEAHIKCSDDVTDIKMATESDTANTTGIASSAHD